MWSNLFVVVFLALLLFLAFVILMIVPLHCFDGSEEGLREIYSERQCW